MESTKKEVNGCICDVWVRSSLSESWERKLSYTVDVIEEVFTNELVTLKKIIINAKPPYLSPVFGSETIEDAINPVDIKEIRAIFLPYYFNESANVKLSIAELIQYTDGVADLSFTPMEWNIETTVRDMLWKLQSYDVDSTFVMKFYSVKVTDAQFSMAKRYSYTESTRSEFMYHCPLGDNVDCLEEMTNLTGVELDKEYILKMAFGSRAEEHFVTDVYNLNLNFRIQLKLLWVLM